MKKWLLLFLVFLIFPIRVKAQEKIDLSRNVEELVLGTASPSAEASLSAQTATGSAAVAKVLEEKEDLTETGGKAKGKLEQYLAENTPKPFGLFTILQYGIRLAVAQGVPANTIVLIFLFPLITALIAAFRHLVGLKGFGLFVPSILSVALVATGVVAGVSLFLMIILVATLARAVTQRMKLQYLPRMALILWLVSIGVFVSLLAASLFGFGEATVISIFPILILILLAENFIELQLSKSKREAGQVTIESLIMAVVASLIVGLETVQKFVILNPELFVVLVALFNVFVGRYVGLRMLELFKYRELLNK